MEDDLVRPDPFYVDLAVANAMEGVATAIRSRGNRREPAPTRFALLEVADAIDDHVSKMRGQLGREADDQARQQMRAAEARGEWAGEPR